MDEKLLFFCAVFGLIGTVIGLQSEWYMTGILCVLIFLIKGRFSRVKIVLFAFFFVTFFLNGILTKYFNDSVLNGNETNFEICFQKTPKIDGDSLSGFTKVLNSGEQLWISYRIQTESEKKLLEGKCLVGEVFKVYGNLKEPKNATVENGFDFHNYLNRNKTQWVLNVKRFKHVRSENTVRLKLLQVREKAILNIKSEFPDPLRSYTIALIFGDQNLIDEDAYRAYQKLGVVHLFSISGAQVGMVVWFLFTGFIRFGMSQKWSMVNVIIITPFYAVLTGFSPSVNRACGMVIILFISRLFGKRITPLIGLCTCMLLYLLIQPYQIYSIGFQLSFSICGGLILSKRILDKGQQNRVSQIFIGTLICQLSSLPILIYHFYEVSLLGFLSNLFYIPIFSFFYFPMTGIVYLFHLVMGKFSLSILSIGNFLFQELYSISILLSKTPFSTVCFGKPSTIFMLSICISVFFVLLSLERNKSNKIILSFFILAVVLFLQYNANLFFSKGEVTFIDVGQGDSILIKLPHNAGNYLIDTGGIISFEKETWQEKSSEFDTGKNIILPLLRSKGIRKLDKLILTHADFDHMGGSKSILENLPVGSLLMPIGQSEDFEKFDWLKQVKEGVIVRAVTDGDQWKVGESTFMVIHPETPSSDKNSSCIVLFAKINGVKYLFTGDADLAAEKEISSKYLLQIDVLKAGHHGSKTSTGESLLEQLCPKLAIISVGENNRYGHPSSEVINRLEENKIQIFRTDTQGSIKLNIKNGTIITYPPYHKVR